MRYSFVAWGLSRSASETSLATSSKPVGWDGGSPEKLSSGRGH